MGTEVLRPQDVFYDRFRLSSPAFHHPRRKAYYASGNGNSSHRKPVPAPVPRPERSDYKRKTHHQSPPRQIQIPRRSPSSSPPPQIQKSDQQRRRASSAPPPPQPPNSPPLQHQQKLHLLFPTRSPSVEELQNQNQNQNQNEFLPRVRILRRGQSLDTIDADRLKRDLDHENRGTTGNLVRDDVYAGSAFFVSPSPSSLPLPSFFNHSSSSSMNLSKQITIINDSNNEEVESHDSATRDLRRLLRLE